MPANRRGLTIESLEERCVLADGDVDLTFGNRGFASAEFYESNTWGDMVNAMAMQADGKFVVAGGGTAARYLSDGKPDFAFGIGGRTPVPMDVHALAVRADGKIWLAGGTDDPTSHDFVLARLTSAGSLDDSFGQQGLKRIDFGSDQEAAHAMVLDSAGRILVAGGSGNSLAMARLLDDGSLDTAFSHDGLYTLQFSLKDVAYAIALQASGRIVVAGSSYIGSATKPLITEDYDMFVVELFPSGALDASFSHDGIVQTSFIATPISIDEARDIAIQSNGQIVITGQATGYGRTFVGTARYNLDGSLDQTFGTDGIRTDETPAATNSVRTIGSVLVRRDGRMVVTSRDRIWQYTATGEVDTSFGSGGSVATNGWVATTIELGNHTIVLGGTFDGLMGVRKIKADGSADTSFSGDGMVTLETGPSREIVEDSLVTPDGKIIAVGTTRHGFFIVRYTSGGRLDKTFSGDGKLIVFFGERYFDAVATSVALTPDGKIVVGGYAKRMSLNAVDSDLAVIRLLSNGTLDASFSYDGRQLTNVGGMDYGYAVAVQPDGKVILAGEGSSRRAVLVRYRTDGRLDSDFSADGIAVMTRANSSLHTLSILPDGKLLAAGEIFVTDSPFTKRKTALMVTRFTTVGEIDRTFGATSIGYNGLVIYSSGTIRNARDLVVNVDGSFFLTGDLPDPSFLSNSSDMAVAKFRSDGILDGSFGTIAWSVPMPTPTNPYASAPSTASSLAVQPDGKVLMLGSANGYMVVLRFNALRSPDANFAGDGFAVLKQTGDSVAGVRLHLLSDGRLIAVGTSTTTHNGDQDIFVTRLQNSVLK